MKALVRVSPRQAVHRPPRPGRRVSRLSGNPAIADVGRAFAPLVAAAAVAFAVFAAAWFAAALIMGAAHG